MEFFFFGYGIVSPLGDQLQDKLQVYSFALFVARVSLCYDRDYSIFHSAGFSRNGEMTN